MKYNKFCQTVKDGRSWRIQPDDLLFTNVPFLLYIIHGAPLAGKTRLADFIQKQVVLNSKNLPIIHIDQIIGSECITYLKYKEAAEA